MVRLSKTPGGPAQKVSSGYYSSFETHTPNHSQPSGNRQVVLIGLEDWSLQRDATSLQGTRLADCTERCRLLTPLLPPLLHKHNVFMSFQTLYNIPVRH